MILVRATRVKDGSRGRWSSLRVRAVAPVAAVRADQFAVQAVHLRAANLALFALDPPVLGGRVPHRVSLAVAFSHGPQYTYEGRGYLPGAV